MRADAQTASARAAHAHVAGRRSAWSRGSRRGLRFEHAL